MKFKKWIKYVDLLTYIVIWTDDVKEEPAFKGYLIDMPWIYMDMKIGRSKNDENEDEPIRFAQDLGEECNHKSGIVVCLIAK